MTKSRIFLHFKEEDFQLKRAPFMQFNINNEFVFCNKNIIQTMNAILPLPFLFFSYLIEFISKKFRLSNDTFYFRMLINL